MTSPSVQCPSLDVLSAFAGGTLTPKGTETVQAHLKTCDTCRGRFTELTKSTLAISNPGIAKETPPPDAESLAIPIELLRHPTYQIKRELGRGGMGVVYLGFDRLMERPVVIKVVNKELLKKPGATDRFLREIRSAARLQHANVMATYAAIQEGDLLAFAMEYVPGVDLAETVRSLAAKGQRMPVANACHYIRQAALGLQHVHEKGMVHRDIKPSNLVLVRDGLKHTVKILDFGLAKTRGERGIDIVPDEPSNDPSKTGAGKMLGTPDYMAPEQALDAAAVDIRADIYALGCSLYYLLAGKPSFRGKTLIDLLKAHAQEAAPPIHELRPDAPPELSAVIAKAMAKKPDDRFQTPADLAKELFPFLKQSTVESGASKLEAPPAGAPAAVTPSPSTPLPGQNETVPLRQSSGPGTPTPFGAANTPATSAATPLTGDSPNRWVWAGVAGVVALVGVIVAAVMIPKMPTSKPMGVLAITGLPFGANVTIDGELREVARGDQGVGEVRLPEGDHVVDISVPNETFLGPSKIYIPSGEQRTLPAKFRPTEQPDREGTEIAATPPSHPPAKQKKGANRRPEPPSSPGVQTKVNVRLIVSPPTAELTIESVSGPLLQSNASIEGIGAHRTLVAEPGALPLVIVAKAAIHRPTRVTVFSTDGGRPVVVSLQPDLMARGNESPSKGLPGFGETGAGGGGGLGGPGGGLGGTGGQAMTQPAGKTKGKKKTNSRPGQPAKNSPPPKQPNPTPTPPKVASKSASKGLKESKPLILGDAQPDLLRAGYPNLPFTEERHYIVVPKFEDYENVYFIHPFAETRPASLDFSFTRRYAGTLKLAVKNYPFPRNKGSKGCMIRVKTNDKGKESFLIDPEEIPIQDEWTELEIPFDHQPIRVEQMALDWDCEGLFLHYEFEENDPNAK